MDDMDIKSLLASEVFNNFVKIEKEKESYLSNQKELQANSLIETFYKIQETIRSNPELKRNVKEIQSKLRTNPSFRKSADEKLVSGILMLDLD